MNNQSTPTPSQNDNMQAVINAPGINHFRLNPFQILRLSSAATPQEAVWQEEKMLSILRLGLPFKQTAPILWLASVNELEIQQAVQKIEEPLERLIEQLFWFDFDADMQGGLLKEALATGDADKLAIYLKETEMLPTLDSLPPAQKSTKPSEAAAHKAKPVVENVAIEKHQLDGSNNIDKAAAVVEVSQETGEDSEVTLTALIQAAAHQLNRANLQLLLAVSGFHGVGPMIKGQQISRGNGRSRTPQLSWQAEGRFAFYLNPHTLVADSHDLESQTMEWHQLWAEALVAWRKLLKNPYLTQYVNHLIQRLDDQLLDPGVVETLYRAIPTRFADIMAGEIKHTMREGENSRVTSLINVAANVRFDQQAWEAAFNSLNYFFQTELAELTTFIEEPDSINPATIRLYFNRLGQIKMRWQALDPSGLLKLEKLLDDAVLKGYRAIASLSYIGNNLRESQDLLDNAISYASAISVREKIKSRKAQITKFHQYETCHFCEQRERDPNYPVVLKGKKETGRKRNFNSTTIYYSIKPAFVPRCRRCAELQDYIHNLSFWFSIASLISLLIFTVDFAGFGIFDSDVICGFLIFFTIGAVLCFLLINFLTKRISSKILVPRGEKAFNEINDTVGYRELIAEYYKIDDIDFRKDALQKTLASLGKSK